MEKILFSVIVPIYNVEKYLRECVESILHQTYGNFELILVDDGSQDRCGAICDEYAKRDERIKVIHKKNGGLVSARQEGAKCANGDYFVCVDGDDFVSPNYLESFYNVIDKYHPDVVTEGFYIAYPDKNVEEENIFEGLYDRVRIENEIFPKLVCDVNGVGLAHSLCGRAFKRELYLPTQLSVSTGISMGEDAVVTLPCHYGAEVVYFGKEHTYYYRQNLQSMTKVRKLSWDYPKKIVQSYCDRIDVTRYDFEEQINRDLIHNVFNVIDSQLRQTQKSYLCFHKEICEKLKEYGYEERIKKAKFSRTSKFYIAYLVLRYRLFFLIKWFYRR